MADSMRIVAIVSVVAAGIALPGPGLAQSISDQAGSMPQTTAQIAQSGESRPILPLVLADERPTAELKTGALSLMITSCEYGIRRVADMDGQPSRMDALKSDLEATLGSALAGKTLTILHYGSYFNAGARLRGTVNGMFTGLVPDLMSGMGSKCDREDTKAGWYQAAEVTTPYSPIVVEIVAQIEGKTYDVRSVYSPEKELNYYFSKDTAAPDELKKALRNGNLALITQMSLEFSTQKGSAQP